MAFRVFTEMKIKKIKGNCITIGAEGIVAFYQDNDFIPGVKVYTIRYDKINKYNALFICTILNLKKDLYSYGRARILEKLKNEFITLPSTDLNKPDWKFMEDYIKEIWGGYLETSIPYSKLDLNVLKWKEFKIRDENDRLQQNLTRLS